MRHTLKQYLKPLYRPIFVNIGHLCFWFVFKLTNKTRISGKNNVLDIYGVKLRKNKFTILGDNNLISIKPHSAFYNVHLHITGSNHKILIGPNCSMQRGDISCEESGNTISIGDHTSIVEAYIVAREFNSKVTIGNDCMLARDIDIRNTDSHSIVDLDTGERVNHARDVFIGDHVWIGAHSRILKGASIANDSFIAMGAIVTSDIPPNSLAAGIPAKVIRNNIKWDRSLISHSSAKHSLVCPA
jgi:acetyltransferase-like isoleucine patch superfamily enzyme